MGTSSEPDIARIYRREFSAAHFIEGHPHCGRNHGHNYVLIARIYGKSDEWLDFEEIKPQVDRIVDEKYDHQDLGDKSCEELASELQEQLSNLFKNTVKIELWETGKFGVQVL